MLTVPVKNTKYFCGMQTDCELADTLTAISVVAGALAGKLRRLQEREGEHMVGGSKIGKTE